MLSAEHAEVLSDQDAPTFITPYSRMFMASAQQLPALLEAYRSGGGVSWNDFGPDMSEGQEFGNRPTYINALAEWFAAIPDVHEKLSGGARMADVGCGGGWSSISLARAYPNLTIDGFDLDEPAVERARQQRGGRGPRRPRALPRGRPAEADHGRRLRPRDRVRVHPRHAAAGAGAAHDAVDGRRGRHRDRDGRERAARASSRRATRSSG